MNKTTKKTIGFKTFIGKFFLINDSPAKVAGGAALGIFLGIIPGEGVVSTLLLSSLFRLNRLAATAGVLAVNMWAMLLVFPPAAAVGGFLFQTSPERLIQHFKATYDLGWQDFFDSTIFFQLLLPMMVGFIIVASTIALIFFFVLYFLLKYKGVKFK